MAEPATPDVSRLAREIECYLQAHPRAADSLEGVVEWWLPRGETKRETSTVQHAVEQLVGKGVVRKTVLLDGRTLYAAAKRR